MARSFGVVSSPLQATTYTHAASAETISVTGKVMERRQADYVFSAAIDYRFGSGNHATSYFSRTGRDELIELPLTWYSENGGHWAMSPGYDSAAHAGFSRKATYRCLFCHAAYPKMAAGVDRMDNGSKFPGVLPQGIDCQRCHGPGLRHVNAAMSGRPASELKNVIVNPATLPSPRRDEVCLQCHLETTSASLPSYLPVYGRSVFSYVVGQPLEQYIRYFDHAPGTGHDDKFEFTGTPYRLRKSRCFTESEGALTCITCHDPHEPDKKASIARANEACVNCHRERLAAVTNHPASRECVTCHMPERQPTDSIHVMVTDHYIRKEPVTAVNVTAEVNSANTPPYRGEVVPYYPPAVKDLYTDVAQVRDRANLSDGIARLSKAIAAIRPANAEFYVDLADAYRHAGNSAAAIPYYRDAVLRDAAYWPGFHGLGLALAATNDLTGALAPLRQAVSLSGGDSSTIRSLASVLTQSGAQAEAITTLRSGVAGEPESAELSNDLGTALLRSGDVAGAERSLREAVRLRPESAAIRLNLANVLTRLNRFDEAKVEFLAAIGTEPALAEAHSGYGAALASHGMLREALVEFGAALRINSNAPNVHNNLGAVMKELGDAAGAAAEYLEAIRIQPGFVTARYNLAVILESQKKLQEAADQLREAVRVSPTYYAAHLKLGEILIAGNNTTEALGHLRQAAASPDKNVSDRASALIKRVKP